MSQLRMVVILIIHKIDRQIHMMSVCIKHPHTGIFIFFTCRSMSLDCLEYPFVIFLHTKTVILVVTYEIHTVIKVVCPRTISIPYWI